MLSIIPLPSGFTGDILANVGTILSDIGGYVALIISVILIGVVLDVLISALRKH